MVELHGLVAAFKLNGQLGECFEFEPDMQRYTILLKSGDSKKVKPQNVKFVAKYRSQMVNMLQIRALNEEKKRVKARSDIVSVLKKWECVMPHVVSARVLQDWAKLDTVQLKKRLLESKKVDIASLSNNVKIVFVSLPRARLAMPDLHAQEKEDIEFVENIVQHTTAFLEKDWFKEQVYFMLPFELVDSVELPMIKRALECSFPLYMYLVDAVILCLKKNDDLKSLKHCMQRLDVACARIAGSPILLFAQDRKTSLKSEVKVSLPSRGRSDEEEIKIVKEIEAGLGLSKPLADDTDAYIQFKHSF